MWKFCPYCGTPFTSQGRFCEGCGGAREGSAERVAHDPRAAEEPQPPPNVQTVTDAVPPAGRSGTPAASRHSTNANELDTCPHCGTPVAPEVLSWHMRMAHRVHGD